MITCHPYDGPTQDKTPKSTQKLYLTRADTFAQKDKYTLLFSDKQCQNVNFVGGKGYSLAVLTSVATNDVRLYNCYQRLREFKEIIMALIRCSSTSVYSASRFLRNISRSRKTIAAPQKITRVDRYNYRHQ